MENFRIRKAEFLNQNSLLGLNSTKIFFAPGVKIVAGGGAMSKRILVVENQPDNRQIIRLQRGSAATTFLF